MASIYLLYEAILLVSMTLLYTLYFQININNMRNEHESIFVRFKNTKNSCQQQKFFELVKNDEENISH